MRVDFVTSAVEKSGYPKGRTQEVAIVGRSNAGKSSFINALSGSKVAKVSQTPGKTRLLNFFRVNEKYHLVDMPGYGFAARAGKERVGWQEMIEGYLLHRKNLCGLLLIMDIRRQWSDDEQLIVDWIAQRDLPVAVILNKADKVGHQKRVETRRKLQKAPGIESVHLVSSLKRDGVKEAESHIYENWVSVALSELPDPEASE